MRHLAAVLVAATALVLGPALPAAAESERMQLHCDGGLTIERTNGASWWGVDHDAGYTTEHLLVSRGGDVVHEKDYGTRGPTAERSTCLADHVGYTWTVQLVRTS